MNLWYSLSVASNSEANDVAVDDLEDTAFALAYLPYIIILTCESKNLPINFYCF